MMVVNQDQNSNFSSSHPSDKKDPSKIVVVTDYVNKKILLVYTSESKRFLTDYSNNYLVLEVDLSDKKLMYNEVSKNQREDNADEENTGKVKPLKYYM